MSAAIWPTPDSNVVNDGEPLDKWEARRQEQIAKQQNGNGMGTPLGIAARKWPTPRGEDAESCGNHPEVTDSLGGAARLWTTPDLTDIHHGSRGVNPERIMRRMENGQQISIEQQAVMWTTPRTITGGAESAERKRELGRTESGGGDLQSQSEQFAMENPRLTGGGGPRNRKCSVGHGHQTTIAEQAETLWQTPATDSFRSRGGGRKDECGLDQQARIMWPSPRPTDENMDRRSPEAMTRELGRENRGENLALSVSQFPSPASRDYRSPNAKSYQERGGQMKGEQLPNFIEHRCSLQDQPTPTDGENSSTDAPGSPRRLNPAFVCRLMNWPWWWTRTEPISFAREAMESYLSAQRRALSCLLGERD